VKVADGLRVIWYRLRWEDRLGLGEADICLRRMPAGIPGGGALHGGAGGRSRPCRDRGRWRPGERPDDEDEEDPLMAATPGTSTGSSRSRSSPPSAPASPSASASIPASAPAALEGGGRGRTGFLLAQRLPLSTRPPLPPPLEPLVTLLGPPRSARIRP